MKHKFPIFVLLFFVGFLAGCGSSSGKAGATAVPTPIPTAVPATTPIQVAVPATATVAPTATPVPTATAVPPTATSKPEPAATACDNLYYPIIEGATWTYNESDPSFDPFSYTDVIAAVGAERFTLNTQFPNISRVQEWACGPDGLTGLEFSGGSAGSLTAAGETAQFQTTAVTGVTLPTSIAPGDEWAQSYEISGAQKLGEGQSATTQGTVTLAFTAVNLETVTTPAGSFQALRIDSKVQFDLTVTVGNITSPVSFTAVTSAWYAPGVGMVKSTSADDTLGGTITIELAAYNLP